jgi:ferrous iron transport protein B
MPEEGSKYLPLILNRAEELRRDLERGFRDRVVERIYERAQEVTRKAVLREGAPRGWEERLDTLLSHPLWGLVVMTIGLGTAFWITIVGANIPSSLLAKVLFQIEEWGVQLFQYLQIPPFVTGFIWNGVYRGLAWVVSVMLPPMAIFFPIFTILEDLGFLPRVAFNLDWLFSRLGAHGKQALTMTMGLGCNAAGVVATRIIESPRERLIAILTNNFVPCNGRWPTLIMLGNLFIASQFPSSLATIAAVGSVVGALFIGVMFSLLTSFFLSRTWLKGEPSFFTLELPPYRKPQIRRIIITSLYDRTLLVLYRAVVMAAPAGGVIWLLGNLHVGGETAATHLAHFLDPVGRAIGLDGVILLAYIIAIPANEIVVPTILMGYTGAGMMIEVESMEALRNLLVHQAGWTVTTAVCLMLFSVLHNPCSTTILTIWKETRSHRWTALGALLPLAIAFAVTFLTKNLLHLAGFP